MKLSQSLSGSESRASKTASSGSKTSSSKSRESKKTGLLKKIHQFISNKFDSRLFFTLLSALVVIGGSYLAIRYAQGDYRLTSDGILPESGLLNTNSFPTGAQVFINDRLVTATDDTLYLEPGSYRIRLIKDGYSPWEKDIEIKKELVAQTNARLFPTAPSLTPLTFTGAENVMPSPDGRKIVYYTASASAAAKKGLYVLELSDNLIPFQRTSRQIAEDVPDYNLAVADFIWSPDSTQLIVLTPLKQMMLNINQKNDLLSLPDISFRLKQILSEWEEDMYLRERQYLSEFPEEVVSIATQSAKNVYLSPDKKMLLYTAAASAVLDEDLMPPVPAANTQPEDRELEPGKIYIYDLEEDKNFKIATETGEEPAVNKALLADDLYLSKPLDLSSSPSAFTKLQATSSAQTARKFNIYHTSLDINTLQWFSDSRHLIFAKDGEIQVVYYDGTNNTTVYSGPFEENFIYPWPDGSRLVILTAFSPDSPKNLYTVELR